MHVQHRVGMCISRGGNFSCAGSALTPAATRLRLYSPYVQCTLYHWTYSFVHNCSLCKSSQLAQFCFGLFDIQNICYGRSGTKSGKISKILSTNGAALVWLCQPFSSEFTSLLPSSIINPHQVLISSVFENCDPSDIRICYSYLLTV